MVVFVVNRKGKIAAEIFDQLVPHLGAAAASAWMLSAYEDLDGLSPIQAIQAGRQDDVRGCAAALLQQPPAKTHQRGPGAPLRD
jgi:hypothetical protein